MVSGSASNGLHTSINPPANSHSECLDYGSTANPGSIIDKNEAIKRIVERDGKTEAEAQARLNNQMSNKQLIAHCNSVFYSYWEVSVTRKQVDKAWNRIEYQNWCEIHHQSIGAGTCTIVTSSAQFPLVFVTQFIRTPPIPSKSLISRSGSNA